MKNNTGRSYFTMIIDDCNELLKHFDNVLVMFAFISEECLPFIISKEACSVSSSRKWITYAPKLIGCTLISCDGGILIYASTLIFKENLKSKMNLTPTK